MWQRVGGLLLVVLISSDGLRKQSKVASNSSLLKQRKVDSNRSLGLKVLGSTARSTALDDDTDDMLDLLGDASAGLVVDLITGLAQFDWDNQTQIETDMRELIIGTSLNLAQKIASAAHPILGIIFSIVSDLIDRNGEGKESALVKTILKQVDKMILAYDVRMMANALSGSVTTTNQISASGNWQIFPDTFIGYFGKVFGDCYLYSTGEKCQEKWKSSQSSLAMVYEIHFLQLAITSVAEVVRYKGKIQGLKNFMNETRKTAGIAKDHYVKLNYLRRQVDSDDFGLKSGEAQCVGRGKKRRCSHKGTTDLWLSGPPVICNQTTVIVDHQWAFHAKGELQKKHDDCLEEYKDEIFGELDGFEKSIYAIRNTADAMQKVFKN